MIEQLGRAKESVSHAVEFVQTSKRALIAEAVGTVVGFGSAFIVDRLVSALVLGAFGAGSAFTALANIEYQDAVQWQTPQPPVEA